jgi:hypothetical protein
MFIWSADQTVEALQRNAHCGQTKEDIMSSTETVRFHWERFVRAVRAYDYQSLAINFLVLLVMFVAIALAGRLYFRA